MTTATLGLQINSGQAVTASADLDKLTASSARADAGAKKLAASAKMADTATGHLAMELRSEAAAAQQASHATDMVAASQGRAAAQAKVYGQAVQTSRFQTANLAAQFNDIGVMMASGQSPLLLAMQQGTQVSQVLNTMGTSGVGALKALGTAFLSVVNPISLVTIGTIAAGAAAFQWFMSMRDEAEKAEDVLERHERLIDRIADKYGEASAKAMEFSRDSRLALDADIRASQLALEAAERTTALDFMSGLGRSARGRATDRFLVKGQFKEFEDAIKSLRSEVQAGAPDWEEFQRRVDEIAQNGPPGLRELADELIRGAEEGRQLASALDAAADSAANLANAALLEGVQNATDNAVSAIERIKALSPDFRSRQQQATDAAQGISDPLLRAAALKELETTLANLDEQDRRREAARNAKSGNKSGDAWAAANDNFRQRIEQQHMELGLLGESTFEIERQRAAFDLLNQAKQAGIPITAEVTNLINRQASEYATATVALEMQTEAIRRQKEEYDFYQGTFRSFMSDLKGNLTEGQSLWDSFGNAAIGALDRIADRALGMAADGLFDMLFGALTGAVTGGLNFTPVGNTRIGMFAEGTNSAPPGMAWVGERGPELVNFRGGEQVIPHHPSMQMARHANQNGTGAPVINITNHMQVMPGATEEDGAAFARGVTRELKKQLPDAIQKYERNPLRRAS